MSMKMLFDVLAFLTQKGFIFVFLLPVEVYCVFLSWFSRQILRSCIISPLFTDFSCSPSFSGAHPVTTGSQGYERPASSSQRGTPAEGHPSSRDPHGKD